MYFDYITRRYTCTIIFFFSSRRRHTRSKRDWSSDVCSSDLPSIRQDPSRRRYFGRTVPAGGQLAWSRPAREVVNFVRACDYLPFHSPWGHPWARLEGREVAILKATPL